MRAYFTPLIALNFAADAVLRQSRRRVAAGEWDCQREANAYCPTASQYARILEKKFQVRLAQAVNLIDEWIVENSSVK